MRLSAWVKKTGLLLGVWNIIKLAEPNTPLNDADHVGAFLFCRKIIRLRFN